MPSIYSLMRMGYGAQCARGRHEHCPYSNSYTCNCPCHPYNKESEMSQPEHKKYIVIGRDYIESQCYDDIGSAEDKVAELVAKYPNLKVAVYKLYEIGTVAHPPVEFTRVP